MKKFVKILAVVLAIVLSATVLYACGGKEVETGREKLVMGTNAAFPPYEYYEGDKIVGIDAEVGALIAEKLDMDFEIMDMDFNESLLSCSAYNRVAERAVKEFWHYSEDVNSHDNLCSNCCCGCKNSILIRFLLKKWYICGL